MNYPLWFNDFLGIMLATYGNLWVDQFIDDEIEEAIKRVWYWHLKDFEPDLIIRGIFEATKVYHYPPKPAQVIEVIELLRKKAKDSQYWKKSDELRALHTHIKKSNSEQILRVKLDMWKKLGNKEKVKEIENAIATLDLQEK